jgi:uncharacterized phage protein (TIGR01671 family)
MSREIKFRAFYEKTKEMFQVDVLALSKCAWSCPEHDKCGVSIPYQPSIRIMQFTGLLDSKGNEVYEGDILEVSEQLPDRLVKWNAVVKFSSGSFNIYNPECCTICKAGIGCICDMDEIPGETEVIGNIYQNEELLKGGSNE